MQVRRGEEDNRKRLRDREALESHASLCVQHEKGPNLERERAETRGPDRRVTARSDRGGRDREAPGAGAGLVEMGEAREHFARGFSVFSLYDSGR